MAGVSASPLKLLLFKLAMRAKRAELARGIIRNDSVWDKLVFRKIQASLGGRLRFVITGAAPISSEVLEFLRCSLGCAVFEGCVAVPILQLVLAFARRGSYSPIHHL